jgi:hypothetical protein
MMYLVLIVKFYMIVSRNESISYDIFQLPKEPTIISFLPLHILL